MTASATSAERITISPQTVREAHDATPARRGASLLLQTADGGTVTLPDGVQDMLLRTLAAIGRRGGVTISQLPDELTSTVAADLLGVSRPTLMKWVQENRIVAHKVGSHTRFRREDVLELKRSRSEARRAALADLLELDAAHPELAQGD